jgi:REP element-mobilizing transposase RayT
MDDKLHQFITEKFKELGCPIRISNGYHDHVHCLFLLNTKRPLDEIIQRVKGRSSHFVNSNNLIPEKFVWQNGYRAFSVSIGAKSYISWDVHSKQGYTTFLILSKNLLFSCLNL